jgi:hypothetical protein
MLHKNNLKGLTNNNDDDDDAQIARKTHSRRRIVEKAANANIQKLIISINCS